MAYPYFVQPLVRDECGLGSFCVPIVIDHEIGVKGAFEALVKEKLISGEKNVSAEWISSHGRNSLLLHS